MPAWCDFQIPEILAHWEPADVSTLEQIAVLAAQLKLDTSMLFNEIFWALGEVRINRVTPEAAQFREWSRQADGLLQFWRFADSTLGTHLEQDEAHDIWNCINLTLISRTRRAFALQDYLLIAARSDQKCQICGRRPPEVRLDIDHILPVSRGGSESHLNLRFLCEHHNRARGNRFHWADIWRLKARSTLEKEKRYIDDSSCICLQTKIHDVVQLYNERPSVKAALLC
jgi:hypothetical protein